METKPVLVCPRKKMESNWNSVSRQGSPAVWGQRLEWEGEKGKADGKVCIRECKMGDVVAVLMKKVRRSVSKSVPCSVRTWGQGFMKKACDVSQALYWSGSTYQSSRI